ncbi:HAMP domain-containing sensor histidine kinase [Rhizomicrobium electricum]|uniref:sensor histidine kinase n=1 Tax=Rhizomicrobium electricum TaxID=480070 RepID=UPI0031D17577|nr:two-component system cell cycle sensor histidine kinase PleC [Rhizomicrobium electricum]
MAAGSRQGRTSLLSRYTFDLGQCVSRQRGERALKAAAMEQALASRTKSEFLANMSHELRTPLNAIIGFSDIIASQPSLARERTSEYAGLINDAGQHLLAVISDILDVAKIESGTFELDLERLPLRDILLGAISLMQHRIDEKAQTLAVVLPDGLPPVRADGRRLKQIVINLLSNAHKFTPPGGTITLAAVAVDSHYVAVSVRDTGIGMNPAQIEVALKPFGQVCGGPTRSHEGTGLGLPIAKALVEQHGGRLWLDSAEGRGTTVAFTIPAEETSR